MAEEWEKQEGANIWLPEEKGDELRGEVVKVNLEGTYGPQWTIRQEDDEEIRTPSHKVLQNRMSSVKVGSTVKIVYLDELPPKVRGQNPTKMYEVFVKK